MPLPKRESPKGKRVSLFVTCMVDMLHPETGFSVVKVLEYLSVDVEFPANQTCCGQPAYNASYHDEAKEVAKEFLKVFRNAEVIVFPSGSCAAMVRVDYPKLFADDPEYRAHLPVAPAKQQILPWNLFSVCRPIRSASSFNWIVRRLKGKNGTDN